jgi:hypothetical protein
VIDLDASIVVCHSEKELAAPTFKRTFGYHPMLAFCASRASSSLRSFGAGTRGSNTAADHIADHIAVLDAALAQISDAHRHGNRSWSEPTSPAAPGSSSPTSAACTSRR